MQPAYQKPVPLKIGLFGEQGTGKTTTAALIAAALSKLHHNNAPVWVTDPEVGWQFPKRRIFGCEKIELTQRTIPTFKAMLNDLREAERSGACVYAVELAKPWMDLLHTVQSRCGDRWGQELVKLWGEWVTAFLNSPLHCLALARVSDITEDVLNEQGEVRRLKVGEGMKAGGQRNNFGYEPHLVVRMTLERSPRKRKGKVLEDEGRMIHRCDVLKDRTWELNGKVFRFRDQSGYKPSGFDKVWSAIAPHYDEMQASEHAVLDTHSSSDDLVDDDGRSAWSAERKERECLLQEWDSVMAKIAGGQTGQEKRFRAWLEEAVTRVTPFSRLRFEDLSSTKIQNAVLILMRFEERAKQEHPSTVDEVQILVDSCRKEMAPMTGEFDRGKGVEQFVKKPPEKTLLEIQLEQSVLQARQQAGD